MTGVKSDSISEKTTERSVLRFFSPLIATMYTKDDWGNLEEYGEEVFPAELCSYETEILKRIAEENLEEEGDRGLAARQTHERSSGINSAFCYFLSF